MSLFVLVGLPNALRQRFDTDARRLEIRAELICADYGPKGSLRLLPHPSQAIHDLRRIGDSTDDWTELRFLIFPYAPCPTELEDEINTLCELGAQTLTVTWPDSADRRLKPTTLDQIYSVIDGNVLETSTAPPSDFFRFLSQRTGRFIVPESALRECDLVAQYRFSFLRKCASAFESMVKANGAPGGLHQFFQDRQIHLATTGGIDTTLSVFITGKRIYNETVNYHLSKGQSTTPQAAVRVYFHQFIYADDCYVVVMYAGPHPSSNISFTHYIP